MVTSNAYGSEGGNDLAVELVTPGVPGRPLQVTVNGKQITVSLATDASGAPASTAAQVVAAINATRGSPSRPRPTGPTRERASWRPRPSPS